MVFWFSAFQESEVISLLFEGGETSLTYKEGEQLTEMCDFWKLTIK